MSHSGKIRVLVVEDSPVVQMLLVHILGSSPRIEVVGGASTGEEALAILSRLKPDVIVMDIHMPGLNGYETTRRVMETQPVPIVICSASFEPVDVANTFRALDAGAVAMVAKPMGIGHPQHPEMAAKLVETVTWMSEVKVVKRWSRSRLAGRSIAAPLSPRPRAREAFEVVAVGTSTGGPPALQALLGGLPPDFPLPLLIVQHIAAGFLPGLVDWLAQTTGFPVKVAEHGETPQPGQAYLGPDGFHLGLDAGGRVALSRQAPEHGVRPAVSHLFRSVAQACGSRAIGILLTGMGQDGAKELADLKAAGAVTFAQDAESSVVHGMPGEAIRLGGASYVLPPDKIASGLVGLVRSSSPEAANGHDRVQA